MDVKARLIATALLTALLGIVACGLAPPRWSPALRAGRLEGDRAPVASHPRPPGADRAYSPEPSPTLPTSHEFARYEPEELDEDEEGPPLAWCSGGRPCPFDPHPRRDVEGPAARPTRRAPSLLFLLCRRLVC